MEKNQYGGTYFGDDIPEVKKSYREEIHLDKQLERVDEIAGLIQDKLDYESAHNQEILQGIRIVEEFLRKTKRVCYGGAAMNQHLPKKYKFYDPSKTIPDYDFYSPDSASDIEYLVQMIKAEGFMDVGVKPGMHEGTTKVYLNFYPIADISEISSDLYKLFEKRAKTIKGINYMDIDSLRMMMYLEISRPRGEISRWKKVYERILLLQYVAKPKNCTLKHSDRLLMSKPIHNVVFNYVLNNSRVFAGVSVLRLYVKSKKKIVSGDDLHDSLYPLVIYSGNIPGDVDNIIRLLGSGSTKVKYVDEVGEVIPRLAVVTHMGKPLLMLVEETACHAYNTIRDSNGRNIRIATLDTLITLYFSLELSKEKMVGRFFPGRINCMAQIAIDTVNFLRIGSGRFRNQFPFISMDCSGHQKGIVSLLREKFERIVEERKKRLGEVEGPQKASSKTKTIKRGQAKKKSKSRTIKRSSSK